LLHEYFLHTTTVIQLRETELIGRWIVECGKVRGDVTCQRSHWLTTHHLRKIAVSKQWGAWEILFQDPDDERYWEQTYPQSEMRWWSTYVEVYL
jgi:hypothetical protein